MASCMLMFDSGYSFSVCRPPIPQLRNCQGARTVPRRGWVASCMLRSMIRVLAAAALAAQPVARRKRGGGLARTFFAAPEFTVFARVCQQEIEPGYDTEAQQQAAEVERKPASWR